MQKNPFRKMNQTEDLISYEVDPADIYPATIDDIRKKLKAGLTIKPHLAQYLHQATQIPSGVWSLAGKPADGLDDEQRELRAEILELARKWFTAELRESAPADMRIELRITKDNAYRL